MQNVLMVLADKGRFKAYNLVKSNHQPKKFELVMDYVNSEIVKRMRERITDRFGRFGKGNDKSGNKGYGEKSNIQAELERRVIKEMAGNINRLVQRGHIESLYLASDKNIHNMLLSGLTAGTKKHLRMDIRADLVNAGKLELLERFNIS